MSEIEDRIVAAFEKWGRQRRSSKSATMVEIFAAGWAAAIDAALAAEVDDDGDPWRDYMKEWRERIAALKGNHDR